MSEFLFLYRGALRGPSPEEMQQQMQKWMAWMKELEDKGRMKDRGHPLERVGKLVRGTSKMVTDGVFTESKDVIGGYTLIVARDLAQAVELSKGCPIFAAESGTVEVRPILTLDV